MELRRVGTQHQLSKGTLLGSQPRAIQGIWGQFEKGPCLGFGVGGEVFRCKDRTSTKTVAIKVMKNSDCGSEEFWKLRYLSHPNILRVFDCVVEADQLFLVTDFAGGGVLADYVVKKKMSLNEDHVVGLMEQVVRAVAYCHQSGLVHNDLKLENVFILTEEGLPEKAEKGGRRGSKRRSFVQVTTSGNVVSEPIPHIVVGDLGHMTSIQVRHSDPSKTRSGDPRYIAPEAFRDACTSPKSDVYSLGVMLFELLSGGCLPYFNRPVPSWQALNELPAGEREGWWIWLCSPDPPPKFRLTLQDVSDNALDLCGAMLSKSAASRPTAIDCLEHMFFNSQRAGASPASKILSAAPMVASRLEKHARRSFIQNALANMIVARLDSSFLIEARQLFVSMDKSGRGRISREELLAVVGQSIDWDEETATTVFSAVSVHGQDSIEFNEFAAAILNWRVVDSQSLRSELRKVFTALDKDGDCHITFADFRRAFPCCSAQEEVDLSNAFAGVAGNPDGIIEPEDLERFVINALGVGLHNEESFTNSSKPVVRGRGSNGLNRRQTL